jgi:putative Holliday junction resolvase
MHSQNNAIIALDVGEKRVGVALATLAARLPQPLVTLDNNAELMSQLRELIKTHHVEEIVVGLPRNLNLEETAQTLRAREFAKNLQQQFPDTPMHLQDEAGTSAAAKEILDGSRKPHAKGDIDMHAATIILEDYLKTGAKV